jgi:hypothetical protein
MRSGYGVCILCENVRAVDHIWQLLKSSFTKLLEEIFFFIFAKKIKVGS